MDGTGYLLLEINRSRVTLFGGLYAYLLARGIVVGSKNPEKMIAWRNKFGPMLRIVGPVLMVWGLIVLSIIKWPTSLRSSGSNTIAIGSIQGP